MSEAAAARASAVLASAVYFKGAWARAFDAAATAPAPFSLASGAVARAPTMFRRFEARDGVRAVVVDGPGVGSADGADGGSTGGFTAVELPYKGGRLAALALLPHGDPSFAADGGPGGAAGALLRRLAAGRRRGGPEGGDAADGGDGGGDGAPLLDSLRLGPPRALALWLPRFRLECRVALRGALEALGVAAPFAPSTDFSGAMVAEVCVTGGRPARGEGEGGSGGR